MKLCRTIMSTILTYDVGEPLVVKVGDIINLVRRNGTIKGKILKVNNVDVEIDASCNYCSDQQIIKWTNVIHAYKDNRS